MSRFKIGDKVNYTYGGCLTQHGDGVGIVVEASHNKEGYQIQTVNQTFVWVVPCNRYPYDTISLFEEENE